MNLKIVIVILLFSIDLLACSVSPHREVSSQKQLSAGGRMGLHGMVVFGNGTYFIEHIPMLHPPHDYQIVASVQLKSKLGVTLKPDLSQTGFTLRPKNNFSLNDMIQGKLKIFEAELYEGSFEQGGKLTPGYENLTVEIQTIKLARKIPMPSSAQFFEVTDSSDNLYRTSIITPDRNIQRVENMKMQKELWCVVGPDFFEFCQ